MKPQRASLALLITALAGCQESPAEPMPLIDGGRSSDATEYIDMLRFDASVDAELVGDATTDLAATADLSVADAAGDAMDFERTDLADVGPRWQALQSLPVAQEEMATVAVDGLIFVIGGLTDATTASAAVRAYDPGSDSWADRAAFPVPAHHINATVLDGRIYATGFLRQGFAHDERTFIYDPATDAWLPGPDLPSQRARGASAVVVIDGKIYVAGGVTAAQAVAWTDVLDPVTETWTELANAPRRFDHAGFGVIDRKLVVAGGRNRSIGSFVDTVHSYDPLVDEWSEQAAMPTGRAGGASAVVADKLYVFGGLGDPNDPNEIFDQVEVYDFAADIWDVLDPMPVPRQGVAAATLNGIIYLPGGATALFQPIDTFDAFVPN